MITNETYRYFKSIIPSHVCEDIIRLGLSKTNIVGSTGSILASDLCEADLIDLKKHRNSNIAWLDGEWIYKWVRPYIIAANKQSGWDYTYNTVENFQFTIYNENQFYDWHADYHPSQIDNTGVRKISLSISLSDPKDYEGGSLEFIVEDTPEKRRPIVCNELTPRGSMVVFPSFVMHKVNPVTKGTRYSLVMWHRGPKWK
jgi:PKHD-type hydroxylase